ncbi:hypothetical protein LshimejAT787_0503510 [Lyophyllum shimeji]|uniref:Uncharacterized protein n=1 Tax=Lyophyllum shimeji TaxID=47721 RepID=A0A9P3UPP5_LYOSH|nr:hypothetical protein LshimejAT787_0503510 [Lyophyllum shimeji]
MSLATHANKATISTAYALACPAALLTFFTLSHDSHPRRNQDAKLHVDPVAVIVQFKTVFAFSAMPLRPTWVPFQLMASKAFWYCSIPLSI